MRLDSQLFPTKRKPRFSRNRYWLSSWDSARHRYNALSRPQENPNGLPPIWPKFNAIIVVASMSVFSQCTLNESLAFGEWQAALTGWSTKNALHENYTRNRKCTHFSAGFDFNSTGRALLSVWLVVAWRGLNRLISVHWLVHIRILILLWCAIIPSFTKRKVDWIVLYPTGTRSSNSRR